MSAPGRSQIHGADFDAADQVTRRGDVITVSLWYPRQPESAKIIEVDLVDVRAADAIRITYDFDRDGYAIFQAQRGEIDGNGGSLDPGWHEVAFIGKHEVAHGG